MICESNCRNMIIFNLNVKISHIYSHIVGVNNFEGKFYLLIHIFEFFTTSKFLICFTHNEKNTFFYFLSSPLFSFYFYSIKESPIQNIFPCTINRWTNKKDN